MIKFIKNIYYTASSQLLKLMLLLLASLIISACDQDLPPIEADDFGYPKVTVYAKGENVSGEEENQLSEWISTGYKYNGDQIVIMAYNPAYSHGGSQPPLKYTWNPWLCEGENDICTSMHYSPACTFSQGYCHAPTDKYETIDNAPCYLSQGQGLYLLVTYPDGDIDDPNTYDNINRLPADADMYTKSLWDPPVSGAEMYNNGSPAYGFSGQLEPNPTISTDADTGVTTEIPSDYSQGDYVGGRAYFKILDRYYDDNSGYQYAVMKRGFDSVVPPPIATVIDFVTDTMDETSETLYKGIVNNSEYRLSLKILLVLYMIVHGILFIGGASDMTQSELMSLFIKLTIVIQLLTGEESWALFNNYFFKFFTSGLDEMIGIVTSNIDQSDNGFTFFDTLLNLLFSYETSMKIQALIWSFPSGFIVTFIIYAGFALFTIAIAKAVMLYLLAYMAISLLIIVSPIFICFMLFKQTRPLFETWLNAFANYFMQAVLVMAALNLFGQIIVDQIYMILGFKACFEDNPMLTISGWCFSKSWFICSDLSTGLVATEVPGYGYNTTTTVNCDASSGFACQDTSVYCEPFECIDDRYPDLPFLDPDIEKEYNLIENFRSLNSLSIPMLYESCILLLMCYLMMEFNNVVPGLGKGLVKGGSAGQTALGNAASSSVTDFKKALSGMKNAALKLATGTSELERGIARRKMFNAGVNAVRGGLKNVGQAAMGAAKGLDQAASNAYNKSGKLKALFYPVKKIKQTTVLAAKATGFVLKGGLMGASVLKDTILKPGNLMIGTPEEIAARNKAVKNAKSYNRAKDAAEGKQVSLSYKEQLTKSMEDVTGLTKFNERVADFDAKYMKDGKLHLRSVGGAMRRGIGSALYNTDTGKAIYDRAVSLKDSIKEEYRARFTEQGRIDRENARKKDNQIRVLAEQYQKDAPERNRQEKLDYLASEALDRICKTLNLDKELLLGMSQADQELYVRRAFAELPEYKRSSTGAQTAFDILKSQIDNGRILRSKRDTDPRVLANEACNALGMDRGTYEALDTKGKLAALEKGLRDSDLAGAGAADAYRAYQHLKQKAEAQLAQEKAVLKEQKRQQSFVYKAGEAASGVKQGVGDMGRGIAGGFRRVQNGLSRISRIRARDITLKNVAIGAAGITYGAMKLAVKPITIPAGMAGRAIKRSLDERGIEVDFSMGIKRPATFSYTRKIGSFGGEGTARDKQLVDYQQRYDKNKLKIDYKNADIVLQESCAVLGITKAAIDTMAPEARKAYIEQAFNSTIDMDSARDFERYEAYRAAQAVVEHHDGQKEKEKLAEEHKKSVIGELNKKEADKQQAIADAKRAEQIGIARVQAEDRKAQEQQRNKDAAQLCEALKMDHKEFMMMDKESQGRYLSRAYAELPQDKKDATLNKLYREIRDDIASNGEITTATTRMNKGLAELGLTEERYNALSPKDRLAALEQGYKETDLDVNGGEKHAAYEHFKRKAQIDVDNLAREEASKGTLAYKAIGAVIDAGDAVSSAATSVGNKAKAAKTYLGEQATKVGNTWDLLRGKTVRLEGRETTVAQMADDHYAHAKQSVNADNAGQLFTEACSNLKIDTTALHSMSKERSLEYISERLNARAEEITKGEKIKENSDAFNTLADSTRAHANLKAILEKGGLVEDPLVAVKKQREETISSYESQHRKDHIMQDLTGEGSSSNSLITRDVGVELGIDGAALDSMTEKNARIGAIAERAAEVLGFSDEDIMSFGALKQEEQLAMLNKAMREETIDLSRKESGNADLSDDKHYLAYRTLKEIVDKNVPASTNPFDDNYVDPSATSSSFIKEENASKKPSIFDVDVGATKDLKPKSKASALEDLSKADLFGEATVLKKPSVFDLDVGETKDLKPKSKASALEDLSKADLFGEETASKKPSVFDVEVGDTKDLKPSSQKDLSSEDNASSQDKPSVLEEVKKGAEAQSRADLFGEEAAQNKASGLEESTKESEDHKKELSIDESVNNILDSKLSTNPFDDNYVDPSATSSSSITEETAPNKASEDLETRRTEREAEAQQQALENQRLVLQAQGEAEHAAQLREEYSANYERIKNQDRAFEHDVKDKVLELQGQGLSADEVINKMWEEQTNTVNSNKGSAIETRNLCILLEDEIRAGKDISSVTLETSQAKWGIDFAAQNKLDLDYTEITALKMMPTEEQLRRIEEIGSQIDYSNSLLSEDQHNGYMLLKEAAQEGRLKLTSEQYLGNYQGVYGIEPPATREAVISEATEDLGFDKKEKLLLNVLDDAGQLEMVASRAGRDLGIDLSEREQLQAFQNLDKAAKLEKIEQAVKSKELNAENAAATYKAYKTLRRIAEKL